MYRQVFNYTRRGLFDRDKLIVLTLLTFNIGAAQKCGCRAQPARLLVRVGSSALHARLRMRADGCNHPSNPGLRNGTIDAAEYEALCKGVRR